MFRSNLMVLLFGFLILSKKKYLLNIADIIPLNHFTVFELGVLQPQKMIVHAIVTQCLENYNNNQITNTNTNPPLTTQTCTTNNNDFCIVIFLTIFVY